MNLHFVERHEHQVVWRAFHELVFFELADVRVHVRVVALDFLGERVDRTGAVPYCVLSKCCSFAMEWTHSEATHGAFLSPECDCSARLPCDWRL
jgi:hypothetical protein